MRKLRAWLSRFGDLLSKHHRDRQFADEIESHVQLDIEENLRRGMSPEEARRQALIKLGGVEQTKEKYRDRRRLPWLESLLEDIRFGLRMLRKNPGFTAVAVLTLALGIGANTAIFSVVQAVVLAPLPYFQPDRLVAVFQSNPRFAQVWISYPNFQDWQRNTRSFQKMAALAMTQQGYNVTGYGMPEHVSGWAISSGFFATLGVELTLGRDFSPEEDQHGAAPVVIISNHLWRNRFDSRADALGKSLVLDGVDYTVTGVLPPTFRFDQDADLYVPLGQYAQVELANRGSHWLLCIARLSPGLAISQAGAEMRTVQNRLDQLYPDDDRDLGTSMVPLKQVLVGDASGTLMLLLGAVALVLLIACANVANLQLSRSATRGREFAIRASLGASRARVVRQLLTESVLLSLCGGSVGFVLAKWGVRPVIAAMPRTFPRSEEITFNLPVLLFALGVAVAVGILFGLAPALKNSESDLQEALKEGGRTLSNGQHRVQNTLVIIQVGLTLVLLVGAGLLFRTIRRLSDVNPGFDAQHVMTFKVGVSPSRTKTPESTRVAYRQLIERIRQIPGVQGADFTDATPLNRQSGTMPFWIGSKRPASLQAAPRLVGFLTGPDYLRTMEIPLLRGRFFTQEDTVRSPCVVAIDSSFSDMYFQDSDPIGQTLTFGFSPTPPCRIVGVVGHVRAGNLADSATNIRNQVYFPMYQDPDVWVTDNFSDLTVVVRTPLSVSALIPAIKAAVYESGSDQPVYDVETMRRIASDSMSPQQFPMILLGVFAGLALVLACVGIYGVISYSANERVHEIGIRMALGAQKRDILRMTIGHGVRLALAGLTIGLPGGLILTHMLSSFSHLLYGIGPGDPLTFACVAALLMIVALLACYAPARRAMRADPMVALRHE